MYAQLDVHFDEHPKYAHFELELYGLMACALSYCNRLLTDGYLTPKAVRGFGADPERALRLAQMLVEAGVWAASGTGFIVVGYLDHNPSKEDVTSRKVAAKRRYNAFVARRNGADPNALATRCPNEKQTELSPSPHTTPSPSPQRGEAPEAPPAPEPSRPIDWTVAPEVAQAFANGITAITSKPCTVPSKANQRALLEGAAAHSGRHGLELIAWTLEAAKQFARGSPPTISVFKFIDWLNSGRKSRDSGVHLTARAVQKAAEPGEYEWERAEVIDA